MCEGSRAQADLGEGFLHGNWCEIPAGCLPEWCAHTWCVRVDRIKPGWQQEIKKFDGFCDYTVVN